MQIIIKLLEKGWCMLESYFWQEEHLIPLYKLT